MASTNRNRNRNRIASKIDIVILKVLIRILTPTH